MGKRRDINLHRYDISRNAYRELLYFCRQYDEKKKKAGEVYGIRAGTDPTANTAIDAERLRADVGLIDAVAKAVAGGMANQLLLNVTRGVPYERLDIPCARQMFYEIRRKFFYLLYIERNAKDHVHNRGDVLS